MIKINKKEIDLSGKELPEVKQIIGEELVKLYFKSELEVVDLGDVNLMPAVVSFALGTITSGFLKEIGKEIWSNFKKIFTNFKSKIKTPRFEFRFEYQGIEIVAEIADNADYEGLKIAFNKIEEVYNKIEELDLIDKEQNIDKLQFVLDENETWKYKS